MGRKSDLKSEKVDMIRSLINDGRLNQREIAKISGVSCASVSRIARKLLKNQSLIENKRQNCKKKRITTPRMDRKIITTAVQHRRASTKTINQMLKDEGITISEMTLRRRFYEANLKCRRPVNKPKLTIKMKKARLNWAKLHKNYTITDWKKVIFSDESRLQALTESSQFVRRTSGEKYNDDCLVRTVKHPPGVMIWSCISGHGPGPIYYVDGTMRQDQYKSVISSVLVPHYKRISTRQASYTFMQDGAPCHTAKSVTSYFKNRRIPLLPWPGNSPDLNPIENCWAFLKSKVYSSPNPTVAVLKENIQKIWSGDAQMKEMIKKSIESMPKRIEAVIRAKGGITKF